MSKLKFISVIQSVFAAFIGVQSNANRQRDFEYGNPAHFIIGGIIVTALFILGLLFIVSFVI